MRQRGILFSGPMVRAILDGKKTQTRRVVRPTGVVIGPEPIEYVAGSQRGDVGDHRTIWWPDTGPTRRSPYGQPGDLLYVRETFQVGYQVADETLIGGDTYSLIRPTSDATAEATRRVFYRADYPDGSGPPKWRPSIFMPKALSRLWLRVTDVRVERVQDISEEDALAEGVEECFTVYDGYGRQRFRDLWNRINRSRGYAWESNPWVWVVSFERAEAPS